MLEQPRLCVCVFAVRALPVVALFLTSSLTDPEYAYTYISPLLFTRPLCPI